MPSLGQLDIIYVEYTSSQGLGIVPMTHTNHQLLNRRNIHACAIQIGKSDVPYLGFSTAYRVPIGMVYDCEATVPILSGDIQGISTILRFTTEIQGQGIYIVKGPILRYRPGALCFGEPGPTPIVVVQRQRL